jgi:alpha-beta hydrolase superfamily lysophospholipase
MAASQETLSFTSGGQQCVAYLLLPAAADMPVPAVALCTGFAGTQDTPSIRAAAIAFADAGFGAFTFDYRGFGESEGSPRQVVNLDDQRRDIASAVRHLREDGRIDPRRIALWGTSLGGGHVVVVGAQDPTIAAVVAQVPFNGFPQQVRGRTARSTLRLLAAMMYDRIRGFLHLSPAYIASVGEPNTLAVMASSDATAVIHELDSATWRNAVAPRVLFDMTRYRPSDYAPALVAPLLVCIATEDAESPTEAVEAIVSAAPSARAIRYPVQHFAVYHPEIRAQILADQIAFLREVL